MWAAVGTWPWAAGNWGTDLDLDLGVRPGRAVAPWGNHAGLGTAPEGIALGDNALEGTALEGSGQARTDLVGTGVGRVVQAVVAVVVVVVVVVVVGDIPVRCSVRPLAGLVWCSTRRQEQRARSTERGSRRSSVLAPRSTPVHPPTC